MVKKAFLVGCNYPGTQSALNGCVNDVMAIKDVLINCKGFPAENIKVMIDTDQSYPQPTGANVRAGLEELVAGAQPGDSLVFHFSGHGTQVPASGDDDEHDRKDEAICPTDLNIIVDDDLRAILAKLPDNVDFLMISDCCHSGSLLDHPEVQITGDKGGKTQSQAGPSLLDLLGGRAIESREIRNRSLPVNDLCAMLTERSGIPTTPHNLRSTLGSMFGKQAGAFVNKLVTKYAGGQVGAVAGNLVTSFLMDGKISLGSLTGGHQDQQQQQQQQQTGPVQQTSGPPKLGADKGILITGCRDFETSADACPGGNKTNAFGALTNSLTTVVKGNPSISYYDLVLQVREQLKAGGFTQNPCLECSQNNSRKNFVC